MNPLEDLTKEIGVNYDKLGVDEGHGALNVGAVEDIYNKRQATSTVQAEPTIGDVYNFNAPSSDPYQSQYDALGSMFQSEAFQPIDEKQIQRNTLRQFQQEVDAVNDIYRQQLQQAKLEGQGRLGSARAIQARSGTLGSDFQGAQNQKVTDYNNDIIQGINSEKLAAIGAIMNTARGQAQNEIAQKRAARAQGADAYLNYLSGASQRRESGLNNLVNSFLTQGVSPDDINEAQLNDIAKQYGVSAQDIISSYQQGKFAYDQQQAEIARKRELEDRSFALDQDELEFKRQALEAELGKPVSIGEGNALVDPQTGEVLYKNPKTYAPSSGGGFNNQMTDNERAFFGQFRSEPIVKNYNEVVNKKLSVDAIVDRGVGGPADLALVFEFMKALDPTSVVRESEYDTAAKSGNIFAGAFARFNGYFKEEGGFLPENVQQEFSNLVDKKLAVAQRQYDTVADQYSEIAQRQGLNPDNVVLRYDNALEAPGDPALREQAAQQGYDYDAMVGDGLSDEEIRAALGGAASMSFDPTLGLNPVTRNNL